MLPEDDPSRVAFESQYSAKTQPTMKAVTDVVSSVLRQHASQKDGAKPQEIKLEDALAGLAPQFFSRQEYLAGLEKYASEIISRIGLDAYNKLRTEAIRYVQGGPAPTSTVPGMRAQDVRTIGRLGGVEPPQGEPGIDLIGELLRRIR